MSLCTPYDTVLNFGYQNLVEIPDLSACINLQTLYINGNRLTSLPSWLFTLTSLVYLDISSNELTYLPDEIGLLTNLQMLSLSINRLAYLPSSLYTLKSLNYLYAYSNELSYLSSEIGSMTGLQSLYLSSNRLTYLPYEITYLPNLHYLDVSFNQIGYISPSILNKLWVNYYGNPAYHSYYYGSEDDDDNVFVSTTVAVAELVYKAISTGWDVMSLLDYGDNKYTASVTSSNETLLGCDGAFANNDAMW